MIDQKHASLTRFREVVDAYGGDSRRWPAADRAALEDLACHNEVAREYKAAAEALDGMLDLALQPLPSPELKADILNVPAKASWRQVAAEFWPFGALWKPAGGLALAFAASIVIAALMPLPEAEEDLLEEIETEILG